jgi:imidazole glycerol phosphate synthase subunit HisF
MMNGFDLRLIRKPKNLLLTHCGVRGGGNPSHYAELFQETSIEAVASASIFHFTQYTPNDIKKTLNNIGKP